MKEAKISVAFGSRGWIVNQKNGINIELPGSAFSSVGPVFWQTQGKRPLQLQVEESTDSGYGPYGVGPFDLLVFAWQKILVDLAKPTGYNP